MPNYISHKGVLHPAKEKVALTNTSDKPFEYNGEMVAPGDPFIYEGPDRASINELVKVNGLDINPEKKIEELQVTFGTDFRHDPEFLQAIRNMQFNTVEDYLKWIGYDEEAEDKKFKEKASVVRKHELPKRKKENLFVGGGKDFSGSKQDVIGGFGDQKERKPAEIK